MPTAPPGLPGTPAGDSPVDRALALSLADEKDSALRWAAALLRSEPASPLALLITARLVSALGRREVAIEGLEACVARAVDAGNLPLAVAACCDLRTLRVDPAQHLDDVARTFARRSTRLLGKGASPPELPGKAQEFQPLASALSGKALLNKAQEMIHTARQLLEQDQEEREEEPKVVPHPLFSGLDESELRSMVGIFETQTVQSGAVLIEEGTSGAEAFIVARGELEVRREVYDDSGNATGESLMLALLGNGALFGEMALLSRAPRAASVIARRPSIILVARKDALDAIAEKQPEVGELFADHCRRRMVENLVRTSSILSAVRPDERPALVERFVTRTYEEGERLIFQGRESEGLHLIASGEVAVMHQEDDDSTLIAKLGVGEVVGEVALVLHRASSADVIANCPTVTLHLPRDRFLDLIKKHPAILAQLYELAIKRDEETTSLVAQEATEADDYVLV
ncbi:MAG: cyclic nucleotide-binding domain-containing protein [Myxococcales bacterium]|nr:cyclic nucleotide-binding domain-containing protein [Myxococcales bacterium]MCB9581451.1 cyclic nucleotide-binding domain-containing protein [Polyangiaceae bacterium]